MDGRLKLLFVTALFLGAIGCNSRQTVPQQNAEQALLNQQPRQPIMAKLFGQSPPGPIEQPEVVVDQPDPKNSGVKLNLAMAQVHANAAMMPQRSGTERDQFIDSARQKYQQVLAIEPDNTEALIGLAKLYAETSNKDRAIQTMQSAVQQYPNNHALAYELAGLQARFEDYAGAMQSIQLALKHDPENRTYQKTLGYLQAQSGQWEPAFGTLMRIMPEAKARYFVGRVMIDKQMIDEGMNQIRTASNMAPDYEPAQIVLADYQSGKLTGQLTNAHYQE